MFDSDCVKKVASHIYSSLQENHNKPRGPFSIDNTDGLGLTFDFRKKNSILDLPFALVLQPSQGSLVFHVQEKPIVSNVILVIEFVFSIMKSRQRNIYV